jgi:glycosyltransferase involved in cell wall biosynthesis
MVIFTVGDEMYQKFCRYYSHVHSIKISLLSQDNVPTFHSLPPRDRRALLRLLFVGRLDPEKGLSFLLQAVAILQEQNRNMHLDIAGSGLEEENLRKLAQELNLNKQISFHGYVPFGESLFSYYRAADFFILPSLSEGIPQVVLEAMAFGVAIIATRIPSLKGIIRHGENGWLVEPGSAMALANAISELTNNPIAADKLRKRARNDCYIHTMEFQQEKMLRALAIYLQ